LTSSSSQREEKKKNTKKEKTIEKRKNAEKGGSLPSSSCFALSFLALASALLLLPFRFKCFLLTLSSSQIEEKKEKHKEKKTHRKEKKCREGKELTFLLLLLHLG
jgi:flagellar biosynthesis protein FlhB